MYPRVSGFKRNTEDGVIFTENCPEVDRCEPSVKRICHTKSYKPTAPISIERKFAEKYAETSNKTCNFLEEVECGLQNGNQFLLHVNPMQDSVLYPRSLPATQNICEEQKDSESHPPLLLEWKPTPSLDTRRKRIGELTTHNSWDSKRARLSFI